MDVESRTMWWTQPKLAMIVVAMNAVAICGTVLAPADSGRRVALVVAIQVVLLAGYLHFARRLGERHLAGRSEPAFDHRLWNKPWTPALDRTSPPADVMPRAGGRSFYRQVLGDGEEARRALYLALSTWEGARLLGTGSLVGVTFALGSSTVALAIAARLGLPVWQPALASLTLTPAVLVLPEALHVLLLRRALLRGGVLERVAVLTPRDAVDLGLRADDPAAEWAWADGAAIFVALGVPLLILVALIAGARGLALTVGLMIAAALVLPRVWRAYLGFLVNTIPFLRFPGPVGVSVLLDLAHRQRANLSLYALAYGLMSISPFGLDRTPVLGFNTLFAVGYLIAVTFNDQFAGYAGFFGATRFEQCFRRSLAKLEAAAP